MIPIFGKKIAFQKEENALSPVNQYKSFEKKVTSQVKKGFFAFLQITAQFFQKMFRLGRQNFTIMMIPHSEKRVYNFKISVFALLFIGLTLAGVTTGFFWYSAVYTEKNRSLAQETQSRQNFQENWEKVREEVALVLRAGRNFESNLNKTLEIVGVEVPKPDDHPTGSGDLASFLNIRQNESGTLREVGELRNLRQYIENASDPLKELGNALSSQKSLLVDIPTLWPLKGTRGVVTTPFGPAEHPFGGYWYLHKGIDIAVSYGTPIVATANGKVSKIDFDNNSYGNFLEIRHNYGFITLYGHMSRVIATKGQDIVRGQVIGLVGSTGVSTGPHVHYEVRIGTQVVDPTKYLSMNSKIVD